MSYICPAWDTYLTDSSNLTVTEHEIGRSLETIHDESFGWALSCARGYRPEAEDILQTAYWKVLAGRAIFKQRSSFKTWLFGVIRRTAQERRRRAAVRTLLTGRVRDFEEDRRTITSPADAAVARNDAFRLRHHCAQLPRRQYEVLMLVFYHDMTLAEASESLGISLGSVRRHYERGKANLRARIRHEKADESPDRQSLRSSKPNDERLRSKFAL